MMTEKNENLIAVAAMCLWAVMAANEGDAFEVSACIAGASGWFFAYLNAG